MADNNNYFSVHEQVNYHTPMNMGETYIIQQPIIIKIELSGTLYIFIDNNLSFSFCGFFTLFFTKNYALEVDVETHL